MPNHYYKNFTEIIKVAFIVQMPEIWNKQNTIYESMKNDFRFDVWLVIVPSYNFEKQSLGEYGSELRYFVDCCNNSKYICAYNNNEWVDISIYGFQYVFYQRPYNHYLPPLLQSHFVKDFSKICYIPYATPELKDTVIYPSDFFSDIYLGFMEDSSACQINNKKYGSCNADRFVDVGYPVFESCFSKKHSCLYSNVMWTPRWNYDPIIGGSHFFEYCSHFMLYDWTGGSFKVRPHPMMWENFLKIGKITMEGIEDIKKEWNKHDIKIDMKEDIVDSFTSTDILISDRSSVIPMFFMTGKPIIYCEKVDEYGELFKSILPGLYTVNSWEELKEKLDMLLNKEDPLWYLRHKIVSKFYSKHRFATNNIISCIVEDARK